MAKSTDVITQIRSQDLLPAGSRVLTMLSGGADSVCLAHALVAMLGADRVQALHVNHGLRAAAEQDQEFCVTYCRDLGIRLTVESRQIDAGAGNVEALARSARYKAAERVRADGGLDLIATGHTASDQAETVLYRLASSPGRRALLSIPARSGVVVRPLLGLTRAEVRAYCRERSLGWIEDETNLDTTLARNRIRHDVIPTLCDINPAAELNIALTALELRDEQELLEKAVDSAIAEVGAGGMPPTVDMERLSALAPPLRRLVLRRLAELCAGRAVPIDRSRAAELERLARRPGSAHVDLPAGVRATSEYGVIRFGLREPAERPQPAEMPVPGSCRFGEWEVSSQPERSGAAAVAELGSADEALVDADLLAGRLVVRGWQAGDRMQPLGLGGSKLLQDLFTDAKVPRSLRQRLPIVTSAGQIVWVAGVACSERFKVSNTTRSVVRLRARLN